MNDFSTRLATGAVFFLVVVGATVGHLYSFLALWLLVSVLGQLEFYRLIENAGGSPQKTTGTILGSSLFTSCAYFALNGFRLDIVFFINLLIIFMIILVEVLRGKERPFENIGYTFVGVLYISLPLSLLIFLAGDIGIYPSFEFQPYVLLGTILTMWAYDSWAYIIGSWLGKHKLYPSVSPGKTWEGFAGGLVCASLWSLLMSYLFGEIEWFDWVAIAVLLSTIGTLGDLTESKLKRSLGVKDSGQLLPGHGGILDRFDAFLMSAPFILFYLLIRLS